MIKNKYNFISLFVVFLLFISSFSNLLVVADELNNLENGNTIYVDDDNVDGPWDGSYNYPFRSIQDAIDSSDNNDTIFVFRGNYLENIIIDKSIHLLAELKTVIDGLHRSVIVEVYADNVLIENFTIINSGGYLNNAGVKLNSNGNTIKNCVIKRTKTGIYLKNSSVNLIDNCTLHTNGEGILLKNSNYNLIKGCCLAHNSIGVNFDNSYANQIRYSYIHTNGIACSFNNSRDIDMFHCNISDNSDNHGGIFFKHCSDGKINDCMIRHNGMGINLENSTMIIVNNCDLVYNTHFAVFSKDNSKNITLSNNWIFKNMRYGIYITENSSCNMINNNFYKNRFHGVKSSYSDTDARYNWWGSIFGPKYFEIGFGSRISRNIKRAEYVPWKLLRIRNIGASWEQNEEFMNKEIQKSNIKTIQLTGEDNDYDDVPDWWEEKWGYMTDDWDDHYHMDPDNDGLNNVEECYTDMYNSNPYQKDIFLEIDWVEKKQPLSQSNKPPNYLINKLIDVFKKHDIKLHVDLGNLGGGEQIPYITHFTFSDMKDLYWDYFLHNDLNNPRKGIFHYSIICDYGPDLNFPFIGWDHLDSSLISATWLKETIPQYTRGKLIVGAIAHQLGSSLGLLADTHGGNDNLEAINPFSLEWLKYRNYKSCMNYYYKYKIFSFSDGTNGLGDYDDWSNLDFSFFKNSHFEWPKQTR